MAFVSQNFNQSSVAAKGEQAAKDFYQVRGWHILGSNLFNNRGKRRGEIDFVATRDGIICFVEVKTRVVSADRFGNGLESVDYYKQKKLLRVVKLFLVKYPALQQLQPRIDVCLVLCSPLDKTPVSVTLIANAVSDDLY